MKRVYNPSVLRIPTRLSPWYEASNTAAGEMSDGVGPSPSAPKT